MRRTTPVLSALKKNVSLFQIPMNLGQPLLGPDKAPTLIMEHGLTQQLSNMGYRVEQIPEINVADMEEEVDIPTDLIGTARNAAEVGYVCKKTYNEVRPRAEKMDNFVLSLGGDHCIPIGTIPAIAAARPSLGVVWVDAHADINTPEHSVSGNMHGMPISFLMGLVKDANKYPYLEWFKPCLKPQDLVYIGLRDLDNDEKKTIKELGIKAFTMHDVDKLGIGRVMEECNDYLSKKENIHLSYDIDALDPFFAPSTGTAVRGGLTFREGNFICEELAETGRLSSMELVEVNPSLHSNVDAKRTIDMAMTIISSSLGQTIL